MKWREKRWGDPPEWRETGGPLRSWTASLRCPQSWRQQGGTTVQTALRSGWRGSHLAEMRGDTVRQQQKKKIKTVFLWASVCTNKTLKVAFVNLFHNLIIIVLFWLQYHHRMQSVVSLQMELISSADGAFVCLVKLNYHFFSSHINGHERTYFTPEWQIMVLQCCVNLAR